MASEGVTANRYNGKFHRGGKYVGRWNNESYVSGVGIM